jgi:5-bromo-4-chloroindolyl phosphate hydrolysis protein
MALASALIVYLVSGKFFKDEVIEVPEPLASGDASIDRLLKDAQESLARLRAANEAIDSPVVSAQIDRMERAGEKILKAVAEKPARFSQVGRFLNYYLPTSAKLLGHYRDLSGASGGENVALSKKRIEESLDLIAAAFEKQLDNLYGDEKLDITTDIEVLEKLMAADGLIRREGELKTGAR